jgi:hypothetical protein
MLSPSPRYPDLRVAVRSRNPLAVISAVRGALRRAGARPEEIASFSHQAFTARDLTQLRRICADWTEVELL